MLLDVVEQFKSNKGFIQVVKVKTGHKKVVRYDVLQDGENTGLRIFKNPYDENSALWHYSLTTNKALNCYLYRSAYSLVDILAVLQLDIDCDIYTESPFYRYTKV